MEFKPELNPTDFDVPEEYAHAGGDTAEDNIGPFFSKQIEGGCETALRITEKQCNYSGNCHGGVLMAFADFTLGMSQYFATKNIGVTISCANEFVGAAKLGDLVVGHGEILRETGSLVFVRALLTANGAPVLSTSGIFKKVKNPDAKND